MRIPAAAGGAVVGARDKDDRDDGECKPSEADRRGKACHGDPDGDRDGGREHPGDRGDDSHPAIGQGPIEGGQAEGSEDRASRGPGGIGRRRDGFAEDDGGKDRPDEADDLGAQHGDEDRQALSRHPAAEVTGTPEDRGGEPRGGGEQVGGHVCAGGRQTEMLSAYQGAVLHGEHPDAVAPPTPPIYAPRPPAVTLAPDLREGTPVTLSNVLPAQYGTPAILDGRPIMQNVVFDPRTLGTDAAAMQYKSGADAQGVTDRLAGVQKWDDLAANKIVVYQRLNGDLIVADGHQRLGLAKRLLAEGKESHIDLVGSLFKESDGWTPADVRAQAAAKNIKELSGSSLDIARVLRDRPGLWDSSFPVTDGKVKQGKGLAQLSDPAWGMALNGHVPLNHAALVGLNVPDKSLHEGIMSDLAQVKPANDNEARMVIADGQTAGYRKEIQEDIFGKTERTVTLRRERAQVYGAVVNLLKEDKRIFGMLDRNAAKIESIGNQLVDSNADQAARAGQLAQIIMKIAERQGPLSAALNRAADEVANGKPVAAAARQFLDKIDDALEAEGIKAAMLTPGAIDPSTPKGRAEQTTALLADAKAEPALTPEALGFAAAAPRAVASIEPSPAPLTTGDPLVDHVTSDPYVASAIADPIINRENDVPYGAGPNKALDRVVNVDRHVPATDKIGGVTYDPAQAVAVHEFTEQHALNELVAAGSPRGPRLRDRSLRLRGAGRARMDRSERRPEGVEPLSGSLGEVVEADRKREPEESAARSLPEALSSRRRPLSARRSWQRQGVRRNRPPQSARAKSGSRARAWTGRRGRSGATRTDRPAGRRQRAPSAWGERDAVGSRRRSGDHRACRTVP